MTWKMNAIHSMEVDMHEQKIKSYTDRQGKRTTLRFDLATWAAIDSLAAARGLNWAQWVHLVPHSFDSRHTDVRAYVVEELMRKQARTSFGPGEVPASARRQLLQDAFTQTDAEFAKDLSNSEFFVDKLVPLDFGGFRLHTGVRDDNMCLWIENGVKGMPSVVVPIPSWVNCLSGH